jgi:hypothetical protein
MIGYKTSVLTIDESLEQWKQNKQVKLMRLVLMKFLILPLSFLAIIQDPNPPAKCTHYIRESPYVE